MAPTRPSRIRSSGTWATPRSETWRGENEVVTCPSMTIWPESTGRRPTIASTSSVWPLPWTPASTTISPARTSRLTPLTARCSRSSRTWRSVTASTTSPGDAGPFDDRQLHVPADHEVGEDLPGRLRGLHRAGDASPTEDRDPVGDLEHLVELVRDEDHGGAGRGESADDPEQLLRLERGQDGGRLVQHEDVALPVEGLEDLHPLAHAHGEILDPRVRVDVQVVLLATARRPVPVRSSGRTCRTGR